MADNNDLKVIVGLDLPKSLIEVEGDLKILKKMLDRTDGGKLKITAGLNLGKTIGNINTQIKQVEKSVNAIKLTPQLDVSNSQINTQFSEQFERIKKTINFHDVALTIKKEMSLIKEAGGDVTKEIENQLAVISENFGKEPEKVKDAFDKIYSIFEQYSSLYRRSNQEKQELLNGLNTKFLVDPNIVGADKNTVGANISKEWYKRIVSAFLNDEEAAKKAIRSIFGRVSIAAEDGLKTGLHQLDTLMKEYKDPLTNIKLSPEETFKVFYEARQKAMATFPDDADLQLDAIETAKKKIEQLINTNLHLVQVNQQVADSENQVAQAQQNVNDNQVSFNSDNDIDNIQKSIQLNEQLVTSNEKLNALKKERTELDEKIKQDEKEISDGILFDTDISQFEQSLKQNKDLLRSVEDSIASETANNEAIKNQIQTLTQQLEQEKKSVEQATATIVQGEYASNQKIEQTFHSLEDAEKYFKDLKIGDVSTVFTKNAAQQIDSFVVKIKGATGVVEKFRYVVGQETDKNGLPVFELNNITAANEGVERLRQQIEDIKSKYRKLIGTLEANNPVSKSILSGDIAKFKEDLDNLGSTTSVKDIERFFNEILTKSVEITSNLKSATTSLNPQENALNHYREMESIISDITNQYNNLVIKNSSLNEAIESVKKHLGELKDLQVDENNYADGWDKKYHEVNVELASVVKLINEAVKAESKSAKADKASQYQVQLGHLNKIVEAQKLIVSLEKRKTSAGQEETAEIRKQIKAAEERIKYHTRELEKKKLLASITQQINENENKAGKQNDLNNAKRVDNLTAKYKEMSQSIIESISNLQKLKDNPLLAGNDSDTANGIIAQIDNVISAYRELFDVANANSSAISAESIDSDARAFNRLSTAVETVNAGVKDINASFAQFKDDTIATEKLDKDFASLSADVDNTIKKLNSLNNSAIFRNHSADSGVVSFKQELSSLIERYNQLKTALSTTPKTSENFQRMKQEADALAVNLKEVKVSNDVLQASLRNADGATKVTAQIQRLTGQIKEYMSVNTKASKKYGTQFSEILNRAEVAKDIEEIKRLNVEFVNLRSQIKIAGDTGKTVLQGLWASIKKFSGWLSMTSLIMRAWRSLKQMISTVKELDTAMTALRRVTEGTKNTYDKFFESAIANAKELKMNLVDLITQSAEWAKRGYDLNEVSTLAKASGIYSVVADIDNATAVQHLTTVLKTYNMTADEAVSITDRLDNIANRYAVTAGDLGEILSHSIASMQVSGNTLDQAIAMGTAIAQITGNANEAGSTLKVLSMRLRGAKTEIEAASEDTDGMAESVSKLREKIMALTNVNGQGGFDIMADADNFKSTYEIMEGISKVWKDISDVNQANKICLYVQKCA